MKVLAKLEQHGMNAALVLFLILCVASGMNGKPGILTATRNLLFFGLGLAGLLTAAELGGIQKMRLAGAKRRVLFVAEYLLIAFSLVLLVAGLLGLNVLTALSRWD